MLDLHIQNAQQYKPLNVEV